MIELTVALWREWDNMLVGGALDRNGTRAAVALVWVAAQRLNARARVA